MLYHAGQQRADAALMPPATRSRTSAVAVGDVVIGANHVVLIAGPCSVEGRTMMLESAHAVKRAGAAMLRGGAYKPRTSPYDFRGLGDEALDHLAEARAETGLPVVTEIMDPRQLARLTEVADVLQVGTRNMHNYSLLHELGLGLTPVLLKRGMSATIRELLLAAEYILAGGNAAVILCERGIRTFETATRNTLDVSAIPVLKRETHLPVIVDPSHAAGHAALVPALALAAIAAGADGLLIEAHPNPAAALSDGEQSLSFGELAALAPRIDAVASAVGRRLAQPSEALQRYGAPREAACPA